MRLQRLEIKGFKSFANETVINFNEDVLGVVGPNGAGKSNLVDAIRWVLGEQKSKDLRLDKMSDVIFNGTKKRKAGSVAYVALTFENTKNILPTEYNIVTIGRYLYRSGESEYRLNNVPCRLKDIRSLFLDTGIGSNSYAIIALGMVEDILADKENARRRMFEQAAGISKYKTRKKETLNKLNSTQADLDRIEDLLYEIEQNLKVLEKQARRTQRYFDLKEKYKGRSIKLAVVKIKDLKDSYQSLSKKIETEQDFYRALDVKIHDSEAALEGLKQKHLDKEKSLSDFQRSMNDLISKIRSTENDKKILEQKLNFLQQSKNTLDQRIKLNQKRIHELDESAAAHDQSLSEIHGREAELQQELEEARKELEDIQSGHGSTKEALNKVIKTHQEKQNELVRLEKQLVATETNMNAAQQDIKKLEDQIRSQSEEYANTEKSLEELLTRIKDQLDVVQDIEAQEFKRQQELADLEAKEDQVAASLNNLNRQRDAKKHEYDLIKSLVDKLEGFPDSIKYLNKSEKWNRTAPLLSDLIYCSEKHRVIIENFLEPFLNHYVVDTIDDAAEAIRLLSDAQKGRANFFVLEAFQSRDINTIKVADASPAIDVVEVEKKYEPVVQHLLQNVFIAGESTITNTDDLPAEVVLLSDDGKYIRKKYSLSGGSVGLFEGKKLGRKKYLKKLEETIRDLDEKCTKKEEKLDEINDQLAALDEGDNSDLLENERKTLEELKRDEVYLKSRLEHFQDLGSGSHQNAEALRERLRTLDEDQASLKMQMNLVADELEKDRTQMESVDDSYNQIAGKLADQNALVNQKNIELIRHQSRKTQIEREQSFNAHQNKELSEQIRNDREELEKAQSDSADITDKIEVLTTELRGWYEERKSQEGDLSGLEQSYYEARGEISQMEDAIRATHKKQTDQQQLINDLKDSYTEVKFKMSNVGERLKIEFDIELEQVLREADPEEEIDLLTLEEKVEKMRNRINNYGEINPMAVDAYNEMNERHETISTQRDDILEARDSLMETIKEIENTATLRFMEAFSQVRENFIQVFRSLFTEDDNCDLILMDPESPLTSPIEIIAKPKGKRPKTLSQLSGGEKTLTAIALLFGLYLLKPAPFCIFDEVDAPLDDTNIEKFNKIIKRFSKESQFIIVTHNKLTMAAVDVIYGVYMEEQGVSNVSPVDFRSFSHTSLLEITN